MKSEIRKQKRERRHARIKAKIKGTAEVPRLCVFRSGKHIYVQLIDDEKGKTLAAASDKDLKSQKSKSQTKVMVALNVGKLIAEKALKKKVTKAVFDRGGYTFHGRIKALVEGAKEEGLIF